jgi:DNA-binding LacI/PurR family transcriptional regulator
VDGIIVSGRRVEARPRGRLAADHLVATGRGHIVHVTGPERFMAARERARGFLERFVDAGLAVGDGQGPLVLYGEWTEQWVVRR